MSVVYRFLQHIIYALYDIPFTQHDFIKKRHKFVLHVDFDSRNKIYLVIEKRGKEFWLYITPIHKQSAIQLFGKHIPYFRISVVHIRHCKTECNDFSTVVTCDMQFETMTPFHGSFSIRGISLEYLVGIPSEIIAYQNHGTVYKTYARTSSKGVQSKKGHEFEEHLAFKLHKPVI